MMVQDTTEQKAIMDKMKGLEYGSDEHIAVIKEYWNYTMKLYGGTLFGEMLAPPKEYEYEWMRKRYANEKVHHIIK